MKTNAADLAAMAEEFFSAYDAHDVEGMLALCADGALGRYAPPMAARASSRFVAVSTSSGAPFRRPSRIFE